MTNALLICFSHPIVARYFFKMSSLDLCLKLYLLKTVISRITLTDKVLRSKPGITLLRRCFRDIYLRYTCSATPLDVNLHLFSRKKRLMPTFIQ